MKELLTCCYELIELELRAQHTDQLFTLLRMSERIDLQRRGGIIETRYSDDQPRDDHGRWTSGESVQTAVELQSLLRLMKSFLSRINEQDIFTTE